MTFESFHVSKAVKHASLPSPFPPLLVYWTSFRYLNICCLTHSDLVASGARAPTLCSSAWAREFCELHFAQGGFLMLKSERVLLMPSSFSHFSMRLKLQGCLKSFFFPAACDHAVLSIWQILSSHLQNEWMRSPTRFLLESPPDKRKMFVMVYLLLDLSDFSPINNGENKDSWAKFQIGM